ncbi:alpha/beta hydrolase, partial [Paenibacillus riograndensis]
MDLATTHTGTPVSRMPGEHKPNAAPKLSLRMIRVKHIIVALLLSVFFFFVFCFIALHGYIAWVLSNPTVAPLYSNPSMAKGLDYEDITFPALDGSRMMQGWYIPSKGSSKTIVFSHGYGANREETWVPMYDLAHYAPSLNFHAVMFDYGSASHSNQETPTRA